MLTPLSGQSLHALFQAGFPKKHPCPEGRRARRTPKQAGLLIIILHE